MTQATSGIADLIARIKQDGVEAGEQARAQLLAEAQAEAARVVAEAKAEAEKRLADADKVAKERRAQLDSELKMAARDFAFRLQERLSSQVIAPAATAAAEVALRDTSAVAALVLRLVESWGTERGATLRIDPALRAELAAALAGHIGKRAADGGIDVVDEAGLLGFRLTRNGEHFVWDVSAAAVARELARLVDPQLRELLAPDKPRPVSGRFVAPTGGEA